MKKIITGALSSALLLQTGIMIVPISAKETQKAILSENDTLTYMNKIKDSFKNYVAGNETSNSQPVLASKISSIEKAADSAFSSYKGEDDFIFDGINISSEATLEVENSDNLYKTTQNIYKMALAYGTYGTKYYHDKTSEDIICDAIQKFYDQAFSKYYDYSKDGLMFGNWWNWEIGMPTQLSDTFVFMEKALNDRNPELIKNYVKGFDNYLRNGKNGDVDLTAPQHTGTNLADITMNRILQGTVTHDEKRIEKAVQDMMSVFSTIDPYNIVNGNTDGVYADGSFIQHHRVAYTGSYGKLLLQRAVQALVILNDTPWQPSDQLDTLQNWVYNSFAPVMYEGYMMEIVKGRAVSRTASGYSDATGVIESMVLLTQFLPDEEKAKMESQIKYMVQSMPTKLNANGLTLSAVVPYQNIMNDENIQAVSQLKKGSYAFNAMDKNIQVGDGFAFALSRSSNRISKYEYMSGENLKPWFQGDGAFYLYLAGRDQSKSFGVNYMAAIDPYRMPGTTVPNENRLTIPEMFHGSAFYPGYPAGSEEQNDYVYFPVGTNHFSGSVTLNGNTVAGMQLGDDNAYVAKQQGILGDDFIAYKNANANKSWFMFGNKIVVLGSDIHDELHRDVTTTIDNRMSDVNEKTNVSAMDKDGKAVVLSNGSHEHLSWIHYQTNEEHTSIGYYFPEDKAVEVKNETRSANLKDIRTPNPDKEISENFFTLTYEHGKDPKQDTYSYVMMPNASQEEMKTFAQNPDIQVLANTASVHVVKDLSQNMIGYNFFTKGNSNGIQCESAASILKQETDGGTLFAVSDPTFEQKAITLTLDKDYELTQKQDAVTIKYQDGKTIITVNTDQSYGKSINFTLKQKAKPQDDQKDENTEKEHQNKPGSDTSDHKENTVKKETAKTNDVDTGDHTNPILPAGIAMVSFGAMVEIYRISKKKRKS